MPTPELDPDPPAGPLEPVLLEPVLLEPALLEPVLLEPALLEPVLLEPALPEPVLPEPALPEPVLPEPALPDPAAPDAPLPDPAPLEPAPLEAVLPDVPDEPFPADVPVPLPEVAERLPEELEAAAALGGHASFRSAASWALASASVVLAELTCCSFVARLDSDCWRLTTFDARCSAVRPASAVASVLLACARFARAVVRAFCAFVGSSLASTWPALTESPTFASTAVSVPLVPKSADAEPEALTFPEALTLDCTSPRATVAVRSTPALGEELSRNP